MYPDSTQTWKISPGKRSTHELDSDSDYVEEEDEEEEMGQEGNVLADMEKLTEDGLVRPVSKKVRRKTHHAKNKSMINQVLSTAKKWLKTLSERCY